MERRASQAGGRSPGKSSAVSGSRKTSFRSRARKVADAESLRALTFCKAGKALGGTGAAFAPRQQSRTEAQRRFDKPPGPSFKKKAKIGKERAQQTTPKTTNHLENQAFFLLFIIISRGNPNGGGCPMLRKPIDLRTDCEDQKEDIHEPNRGLGSQTDGCHWR